MYELRRLFPDSHARVLLFPANSGPTGNVKDVAVRAMIDSAEQLGLLSPKSRIIEATSGGEGVALASAAAKRGLRVTIVAPEGIDARITARLEKLGAKLEITPGKLGMTGAVNVAKQLAQEHDAWSPNLFENPANPGAHEVITAPRLWRDAKGRIDAFVCAIGSGGTFVGISRFLKRQNPTIRRIVVEPKESPVLSGGKPGSHAVPGIGAGFIPPIFDPTTPTDIATTSGEEAREWSDRLAKTEGILAGASTGANLAAVAKLLENPEFHEKTIVTIAFDRGY